MSDLPPVLTPKMVAEHWACSEQLVRNLVASGKLRSFRVGRLLRIRGIDVEEFERNNAEPTWKGEE